MSYKISHSNTPAHLHSARRFTTQIKPGGPPSFSDQLSQTSKAKDTPIVVETLQHPLSGPNDNLLSKSTSSFDSQNERINPTEIDSEEIENAVEVEEVEEEEAEEEENVTDIAGSLVEELQESDGVATAVTSVINSVSSLFSLELKSSIRGSDKDYQITDYNEDELIDDFSGIDDDEINELKEDYSESANIDIDLIIKVIANEKTNPVTQITERIKKSYDAYTGSDITNIHANPTLQLINQISGVFQPGDSHELTDSDKALVSKDEVVEFANLILAGEAPPPTGPRDGLSNKIMKKTSEGFFHVRNILNNSSAELDEIFSTLDAIQASDQIGDDVFIGLIIGFISNSIIQELPINERAKTIVSNVIGTIQETVAKTAETLDIITEIGGSYIEAPAEAGGESDVFEAEETGDIEASADHELDIDDPGGLLESPGFAIDMDVAIGASVSVGAVAGLKFISDALFSNENTEAESGFSIASDVLTNAIETALATSRVSGNMLGAFPSIETAAAQLGTVAVLTTASVLTDIRARYVENKNAELGLDSETVEANFDEAVSEGTLTALLGRDGVNIAKQQLVQSAQKHVTMLDSGTQSVIGVISAVKKTSSQVSGLSALSMLPLMGIGAGLATGASLINNLHKEMDGQKEDLDAFDRKAIGRAAEKANMSPDQFIQKLVLNNTRKTALVNSRTSGNEASQLINHLKNALNEFRKERMLSSKKQNTILTKSGHKAGMFGLRDQLRSLGINQERNKVTPSIKDKANGRQKDLHR